MKRLLSAFLKSYLEDTIIIYNAGNLWDTELSAYRATSGH